MYPFEVPFAQVQADPEPYVSAVFSSLESEFLDMPRGPGFIEYSVFEQGYEELKKVTRGFIKLNPEAITDRLFDCPIIFVVLRAILGFTPPEWAYLTSQRTTESVGQGAARSIDRRIRMSPESPIKGSGLTAKRIRAMVKTACDLIDAGAPDVGLDHLHRLDKIDTKDPGSGIRTLAKIGVPYTVLLYERFLGRPFAGHRDSVSEIIGDSLESAIEDRLTSAGITFRKTKRADRIPGFDQAPDFVVPSELNPRIVIEAKITEDDGTARDKVTRIQHLGNLSTAGLPAGARRFEVIACIGGRGFGVRREDMRKMLLATQGKVFTLKTLDALIGHTQLSEFRTSD